MSQKKKSGYFVKHAKSSAALLSLGIHAVILVVAISFVAVTVIQNQDPGFEAQNVERPRMKLKKLQVPVKVKKKKTQVPKLRKRIVTKTKLSKLDIQMPEISGIKGGTGYLNNGGGLGSLGFGLDLNLFGGKKGSGNELEGTFFDLKQEEDGDPSDMNPADKGLVLSDRELLKDQDLLKLYDDVVRNFANSWSISRLERYFQAPTKRFATFFMFPYMGAKEAPEAFDVEDVVKPRQWVAYYNGKIAARESGKYRFWGIADDVLLVRIDGDLVLDGCYPGLKGKYTGWKSDDPRSRTFKLNSSEQELEIGDWFTLRADDPTEMEVLVGERPGGQFFCRLLIEQEGVEYPKGPDGRPILPVFRTVQKIPPEMVEKMKIDPGTCTIDGPSFGVLR